MAGRYIANFEGVAVTADQDFFELAFPTDVIGVLLECKITQETDFGDAEAEHIRCQIKKGVGSTSGSGGTTQTPLKLQTGSAASGIASVERNNDTIAVAGGGSLTLLVPDAEHIANGWHYLPIPECRITWSPGEELYVSLAADPTDSLTMNGYIIWEELGG